MRGSRSFGGLFIGAVALTVALIGTPPAAKAGVTVVELFTSQGCSSCPPADKLLGSIAERDDILALSMNVDYWDYLGWKDSLGSPVHSARQRAYAKARGDRAVYTPQIVINGRAHIVGSDRPALGQAISKGAQPALEVTMETAGDEIIVTIPAASSGLARTGKIWLVGYQKEEPVQIKRGENAGRTIAYHNVVRKMVDIGEWTGGEQSIRIAKSAVFQGKVTDCAVIVQENVIGGTGPIIGAARIE